MVSVSKGFVDGGMISAPSNLRGVKMGLRELVDAAEYGIPYVNSPLSTRRSFIKTNRDTVLRVLRAYHEAVQETRSDKMTALRILAKYVRVDDPEILNEVYRSYGQKHLLTENHTRRSRGSPRIAERTGQRSAAIYSREFCGCKPL